MRDITLDALRQRERELEFDACLIRGRVEEVRRLIAELEHSRGGRPRKCATIAIVPQRVTGGIAETQTDEQGEPVSIGGAAHQLSDGEAS